ncbi:MAG: hypothetical protein KIT27_07070 [Legionellales bacterium]|nr:hypothetical protein [Legionellales bacterium]
MHSYFNIHNRLRWIDKHKKELCVSEQEIQGLCLLATKEMVSQEEFIRYIQGSDTPGNGNRVGANVLGSYGAQAPLMDHYAFVGGHAEGTSLFEDRLLEDTLVKCANSHESWIKQHQEDKSLHDARVRALALYQLATIEADKEHQQELEEAMHYRLRPTL